MTKKKNLILALGAAGILLAAGGGLFWAGMQHGMHAAMPAMSGSAAPASGDKVDPATGRSVLYWHDPMVPGQKFDKPGKSPFMDMQLVPVYAGDDGDDGKVAISPRVQQNLGIRTAEVKDGSLATALDSVGSVAWNERDLYLVQARANGYVEHLYVRAPLDPVRKGQALADIYVPDWVAAQEDYLAARRMSADLADAARQRMRLAGMTEEQIRQIEKSGRVHPRLTITSPVSGVVAELSVREGMTIMSGAPLYRINGLSTVWVNAEIPEAAAAQVRPGSAVEARAAAWPGMTFQGKVGAILPEIDPNTRTLKARIELANPQGRLVPGMFATVSLTPAAHKAVLLVPSEAVIQTGTRSVVFVVSEDGKFAPVEVETASEANGQTEIRSGLASGQKVVASGQFLVDSEASLKGTIARMGDAGAADSAKQAAAPTHHGRGRVEKIDPHGITLSHEAIPTLQWGPMTMPFKLPAGGLPRTIAVGDQVTFEIRQTTQGDYQIVSITPAVKQTGSGGGK
ncbi:efflux RND transporter periplasmic adaptor subunit [Massilia sp. NEAU-DD11]|uniref:Efflux RND transporter periplasmic adaptor subunit n=1 Tax=Massilia cellulosiltytica TaxID=2683234 RepID=A0A7X3FZX3_9BURK|nr:efflux RND transporter periplasmic adaptor subunit [Telluria cellulosilytica]MVW61088.1 efflux RND transporter periplasmic adaptor subunit [Telluria cellulosilytica]